MLPTHCRNADEHNSSSVTSAGTTPSEATQLLLSNDEDDAGLPVHVNGNHGDLRFETKLKSVRLKVIFHSQILSLAGVKCDPRAIWVAGF